jgi:hypothetical protein
MQSVQVGKEASRTGSESYIQTYQNLLRQKERIDRNLMKLQSKLLRAMAGQKPVSSPAKYVSRLPNTTILVRAIRECMTPNKEMTMSDILESLHKKDLYHTQSQYFYTMVNNKLNRDSLIHKVRRGVFMFKPRRKKGSAVA